MGCEGCGEVGRWQVGSWELVRWQLGRWKQGRWLGSWGSGATDRKESFLGCAHVAGGDVLVGDRPGVRCGGATHQQESRLGYEHVAGGTCLSATDQGATWWWHRAQRLLACTCPPNTGAAASAPPIMLPYLPRHLGSAGIADGTRFRSGWLPILRRHRCKPPT